MAEEKFRVDGLHDSRGRKFELEKLRVRQEERARNKMLSSPEEEDTGVIESRAMERVEAATAAKSTPPSKSDPPSASGPFGWLVSPVLSLVRLVPSQHRVWPVMLLLVIASVAVAKYAGWL